MRTIFRSVGLLALLTGLMGVAPAMAAPVPSKAGELKVEDNAKLFSEDAVSKMKRDFANWVSSKTGREVTFWTVAKLSDAEKTKRDALKDDDAKRTFLKDLAKSHAMDEHDKGVFIFICRNPAFVGVIVDKDMREKGFDNTKESKLHDLLFNGLKDAHGKSGDAEQQTARDATLRKAVEFLENNLPDAKKDVIKTGQQAGNHQEQTGNHQAPADEKKGSGLAGLLCVGLIVLGVGWVLFAVIKAVFRMMSGGGAGGGPGYGGAPGYGGGGGGGMGFLGTFMTGMFGAAAGMWMYDSFFGHHGSSAYGGDSGTTGYGGGGGNEVVDNTGAGDFSGDAGTGGYYDSGNTGNDNTGGGDWGGGGGDGGGGGGGDGEF
ncbi:hypothetical protein [Zavarzinella formosa]|uniref:hypothetical protein n=1 Tax=Zavarzinella formosa TaxID=360055 RepID=UPI0003708C9C|nr:hypothetical protein [Zavarzinella formosa]